VCDGATPTLALAFQGVPDPCRSPTLTTTTRSHDTGSLLLLPPLSEGIPVRTDLRPDGTALEGRDTVVWAAGKTRSRIWP
jgi:hypothetical protein